MMSLFFFVATFYLVQVIAGEKLDLKCKCDDSYALLRAERRLIGTACIDGECGMNATKHAAKIQACKDEGQMVEECENIWEPVCTSTKQDSYMMQACSTKAGLVPVNPEQKCFTVDNWDIFYCTTDNCNIPYDEACANTKKFKFNI